MSFTAQELIECAQRELAMRRTCYPKWAAGKPLTPSKQKEIDMMEAIVALLGNMESMQQTNQVLANRLHTAANCISERKALAIADAQATGDEESEKYLTASHRLMEAGIIELALNPTL